MGIENLIPEDKRKTIDDAKESADWTIDPSGLGHPSDTQLYSDEWLIESIKFYLINEIRDLNRTNWNKHPHYPSADIIAKRFSENNSFEDALENIAENHINIDDFKTEASEKRKEHRQKAADRTREFLDLEPEVNVKTYWKIGLEPVKYVLKHINYRFVIEPVLEKDNDWKLFIYNYYEKETVYETYGTIMYDQFDVPEKIITRINRAMRFLNTCIILTEKHYDKLEEDELYKLEQLMGLPTIDSDDI